MKCSFCGSEAPLGTGLMYVKKEGTVFFFCSSKCERNLLKLKRNPRKSKWTEAHRKAEGKAKGGKEGQKS